MGSCSSFRGGCLEIHSPAKQRSIMGEEVRFRLHSGTGASSIPRERSSRDLYSTQHMRVNGQPALEERQEGTEKSIDAFLLGSALAL